MLPSLEIIVIVIIVIIIIIINIITITITSMIFREWVKRTMVLTLAALRTGRVGRRAMKLFSA